MKKVILSLTLIAATFSYAQKKEIAAAVKAIESGDSSTANSQISAAESQLGGKLYLLEPSVLEQYYYAKGLSLFKAGKVAEGGEILAKIGDLGKQTIYTGKQGKDKVYFVGKAAADQSGVSGLKEEKYAPTLASKIGQSLEPTIQAANKAAMAAYEKKDYNTAGPKFGELYNLLKAAGQDNKQYLYYSAITLAVSDHKDKAVDAFNQLIDSGYTGAETKYLAKDKAGQTVALDKNAWDLYKKMGAGSEYKDFTTETAKSIEQELYESNIALLSELKRYDEAVALADKGIKKFPNNPKFEEAKGLAFYNSGKTDQFMASLKEAVAKNPSDKNSWYNLGVLAGKDPARLDEALGYLKKATDLDPKFANAWQNMAFLTIGDDDKTMADYNALRKSGKVDEANAIIDARRKRMAAALPVAEKWYQADPENIDAVSTLRQLYTSTRNEAKAAEFKAKEAALKAKGK